jgi:hypothetical protein
MILDKLLQFDPAATAITVSADSSNILDLLNARDLFHGEEKLVIVLTVGTAFAAVGAATLTVALQSSADNITYNNLIVSDAIPKANLTANSRFMLPLPSYLANPQALLPRYLKLRYTVATGPFTAGTIESDLTLSPDHNLPPTYAAGITVAN